MTRIRTLLAAALVAFASCFAVPAAFATETVLTPVEISTTGASTAATAAAAGGNSFQASSDARTFVRVANASGSSITVTLVHQTSQVANVPGVGTIVVPDIAVSVPATTGDLLIGPIQPAYIDTSGYAHLTFSAVSSVTVRPFHLSR